MRSGTPRPLRRRTAPTRCQ